MLNPTATHLLMPKSPKLHKVTVLVTNGLSALVSEGFFGCWLFLCGCWLLYELLLKNSQKNQFNQFNKKKSSEPTMRIPTVPSLLKNAKAVYGGLPRPKCSETHVCRICTRSHAASQCGYNWASTNEITGRTARLPDVISDTDLSHMIQKYFSSTRSRMSLRFCELPCQSCLYLFQQRQQMESTAVLKALWWALLPSYVFQGGTDQLALLPMACRQGSPIIQRACSHMHSLPDAVNVIEISDLYSLLAFILQNPDTKCAECSTSLFPEEVHWLPWWKFPYMQKEGGESVQRVLSRFGKQGWNTWPNVPDKYDVHELAPDWRVTDKTPYGFDCTVRVKFSESGPNISVCKEDCEKTRPRRWFHPPKNTSLLWPDVEELARSFNPPDGISLQHLAPVQCRTSVLRPAEQGLYNTQWQMLMLCSDKSGVSTGSICIPYSRCTGRGLGWMGVKATELWENTILQTRPDLAPWHATVFADYNERMRNWSQIPIASFAPLQPTVAQSRNERLPLHHEKCSHSHCYCKEPYTNVVMVPRVHHETPLPDGVEIVVSPALIQWLDENIPATPIVEPKERQYEHHKEVLAYAEQKYEAGMCTGYERCASLANHVFFTCLVDGLSRARKMGKNVSIAYAAFVNRCKDLQVPTDHALGMMFPYHYSVLHDDGTPVGSIPSTLWPHKKLERAGFAPLSSQIKAMLCRLGSSTAYDPVLHSTLFSLLLANAQQSCDSNHVVKYGLENAFPNGVSANSYKAWYGHEVYDYTTKQQTSSQERFLFLNALVKRFQNICWFLTVTLNMSKTAGFEKMTENLRADNQSWSAHCTMFVRKWHRTVQALVEWLVNGKEQPLGPLRHRFLRAEFQPERGGLQHYHILLETLLAILSTVPHACELALSALRRCVTRNLAGAMLQLGIPQRVVEEVNLFASVILKHNHDADCMTKVCPVSGNVFCKRGCPWAATPRPEGESVHIRLCADRHVKDAMLQLGIAYTNDDGSLSLHGIPDAEIHLYQTGGLGTDEMSCTNVCIFLIIVANTNLQLVNRNFVVDYLELYTVADNERSVMYAKHNHDGTFDMHANPDNWHKQGPKPHTMMACSMSTTEMIFLVIGCAYVICDVERRRCPAVRLSRRFLRYYNSTCIARYGVIDERNNVTAPVNLSCIGHSLLVNPLQSGRGRSSAMIWTPMDDLAGMRTSLGPKFSAEQIDLYLSFFQVNRLQPDEVSLWAGRDPELLCLKLEDYLSHTYPVNHIMSRLKPNPTSLLQTAAQRGYFRDVFGQMVLLRASLFIEDSMQEVTINLVVSVCGLDRKAATSLYEHIKTLLPCEPRHHRGYDFSELPVPFNRLIGTLTDCVTMLKCYNPCDGPEFLYQWALRNSYGPTEADIFCKLRQGGSLLDVLEDNSLLTRQPDGSFLWQSLIVQHFYKDMQFQPLHRQDKEGILQRSMEEMNKLVTAKSEFITCIGAGALDEFRRMHGDVHLILYNQLGSLSLACLREHTSCPHAVLMACSKLDSHEASLVAGHLQNCPTEILELLKSMRDNKDLLVHTASGPLTGHSCSTSLAVINNEHQQAFTDLCNSRLASLREVTRTLPEWKQIAAPEWAKDDTCKCDKQTAAELFPCAAAWRDMQVAITMLTNALHEVRNISAHNIQRMSLLLTGPAGCGKTHLLKETLRRALVRCVSGHCSQCMAGNCCGACRLNCECAAATSLRSASLCSYNLHKLFGWKKGSPFNQDNPTTLFLATMAYLKRHPHKAQYLRLLEVFFCDELAFVPNSHMEAIHMIFKELKQSQFFCGNVLIIATSDHYQNEPIKDISPLDDAYCMQFFLPLSLHTLVRCQCSILSMAAQAMRTPQMCQQGLRTVLNCLQYCNNTPLHALNPDVPVILGKRTNMETIIQTRVNTHKETVLKIVSRDFTSACGRAAVPTNRKTHHTLLDKATRTSHCSYFATGQIVTLKFNLDTERNLINGSTHQVVKLDKCNETLMCKQLCPPPAQSAGPVRFTVVMLPGTANDGPLTLHRRHMPVVPSFVDTCHSTQGNDYTNGVALYADGSVNSVWSRQMLYTTICRAPHIGRITLLGLSPAFVKSLLMVSMPRLASIDEWIHTKDAITGVHAPFQRHRALYLPFSEDSYPLCEHVCYCIANETGHTYIGYTGSVVDRIRTHNTVGSKRPAIMDYIPCGWRLLVWVGPFGSQSEAEDYERQWQSAGKTGHMRSLGLHVTAALSLSNSFEVTVHYRQVI